MRPVVFGSKRGVFALLVAQMPAPIDEGLIAEARKSHRHWRLPIDLIRCVRKNYHVKLVQNNKFYWYLRIVPPCEPVEDLWYIKLNTEAILQISSRRMPKISKAKLLNRERAPLS